LWHYGHVLSLVFQTPFTLLLVSLNDWLQTYRYGLLSNKNVNDVQKFKIKLSKKNLSYTNGWNVVHKGIMTSWEGGDHNKYAQVVGDWILELNFCAICDEQKYIFWPTVDRLFI
jgi:hypothetical protein